MACTRWPVNLVLVLQTIFGTACLTADESQPAAKPSVTPRSRGRANKAITLDGAWEKNVHKRLVRLIKSRGKSAPGYNAKRPPVVVFDFDNTCIRGDIGRAFFDWMTINQKFKFNDALFLALPADKRDDIKQAWLALNKIAPEQRAQSDRLQKFRKRMHQAYWALCHEPEAHKCYPWQVRFYAGYTPDEIRSMAKGVFEYELKRKMGSVPLRAGALDNQPAITSTGIRIYKEMIQLMQVLKQQGFQLWVMSAGPQWVVQGAADFFPLETKRMIGMRTILESGKITTNMEDPPTFRDGKVKAIKKFIGTKPVLAIGDSWTDAEMLSYSENAMLIDRGYADLKQKAQNEGWWIQPAFPVE